MRASYRNRLQYNSVVYPP